MKIGDIVEVLKDYASQANVKAGDLGKIVRFAGGPVVKMLEDDEEWYFTSNDIRLWIPLTRQKLLVKFKKLREDAHVLQYAKDGDAGLDFRATHVVMDTSAQITFGTGIAVEIPKGYVGLIFPRSSIRNYELTLSNSVGVIDSGYRGEICFTFNKLLGMDSLAYKVGDKIGQIIVMSYPHVELSESKDLSETERGDGGFGSSGA